MIFKKNIINILLLLFYYNSFVLFFFNRVYKNNVYSHQITSFLNL
jgi:hypothetical protein